MLTFRATHIILAVIVAASLAARIAPALRCQARPEYSDMERYNEAALGIEVPEPLPPGYPLFLRAVYALFGARNYRAVFLAQSIMSSMSVLLLFWIARRLCGDVAGLVAAGIAAAYPSFIVYNLTTMAETAGVFLVVLLLAILVSPLGDAKRALAAAIALFVAYLFKPVFVLFAPGIFAATKKRLIFAAVLLACLASWIAVSSAGRGYHRAARALFKTYHPESDGKTYVDVRQTDLADRETPTKAYVEQAWSYISEDGWRIAEVVYNKGTIVFSRGWDTFVLRPLIGAGRETASLMMYAYVPVMLLGFAGMARLYNIKNRVLALSAMSYLLLIILFAIFKVRYRLLVEPALIVYASMMIVWLLSRRKIPPPHARLREPASLRAAIAENWDLLAVFLLAALALRLYFALAFDVSPAGTKAMTFDSIAASGRITDATPPLYPLFLRAIYAVFGAHNHRAVYAVQGVVGSACILILWAVVSTLHGNRAGIVAAAIAAFYPGFILYGLMTLPEIFGLVIVLAIMTTAVLKIGDRKQAALSGFLVGLAVLLKPLFVCLAPGAAIAMRRRRIFVLALMLTLVPVTLVNALRFRKPEPVFRPASFGLNAKVFTQSANGWRALDKVYNNANALLRRPWGVAKDNAIDAARRNSTLASSYIFSAVMLLGLAGLARRYSRSHRRAMLPVLLYLVLIILFSRVERNDRIIFEPLLIAYAAMLVCGKSRSPAGGGETEGESPA